MPNVSLTRNVSITVLCGKCHKEIPAEDLDIKASDLGEISIGVLNFCKDCQKLENKDFVFALTKYIEENKAILEDTVTELNTTVNIFKQQMDELTSNFSEKGSENTNFGADLLLKLDK